MLRNGYEYSLLSKQESNVIGYSCVKYKFNPWPPDLGVGFEILKYRQLFFNMHEC